MSELCMRPMSRSLIHLARVSPRREEDHMDDIATQHQPPMGYKPMTKMKASTSAITVQIYDSRGRVCTVSSSTATFSTPTSKNRMGSYH